MMKKNLIAYKDTYFLEINKSVAEILKITPKTDLELTTDGTSIIVKPSTSMDEDEVNNNKREKIIDEDLLDYYWDLAAKQKMREKFMGSIRPELKKKLNFDFTEIVCEQEAKKLCYFYHLAKVEGKTISPPYLDITS
jgi:hypothetical protein